MRDSQGTQLRHVVETGDWNTTDVVVVQCARREGDIKIEKKGGRESEGGRKKKETMKWKRRGRQREIKITEGARSSGRKDQREERREKEQRRR